MARPPAKVKPKRRRIIVALDASAPARAALQAAAELAARREAELLALFVEDMALLHLAALPFAREIGFPSAASRALDVSAMERLLRLHAEEARRVLVSVAERTPLKWTLEIARGPQPADLQAAASEAELIVAALFGPGPAAMEVERICRECAADLLSARSVRELAALLEELRRRS
jgi:nucleotide-binding universal stress UspA family protein